MPRDYRSDLESESALLRGHAASMLSDSFEDSDGDLLVTAMLREKDPAAFRKVSRVVMGKWPVKMERTLLNLNQWPIAPNCTVWFSIKSRMWSYPSYERFLLQHITGDEWLYKCAAAIYSRYHGFHFGLLRLTCDDLLFTFDNDDTDWDAVAFSTGLRSKRRLRQKIERIAFEMTPAPVPEGWLPPADDR